MKYGLQRSLAALLVLAAIAAPMFTMSAYASNEAYHERRPAQDVETIEVGLGAGDEGKGVRALQQYLDMAGFLAPDSATDSVFDQATEQALVHYQRHHRLGVTGTVTAETRALLAAPRYDDMPDISGRSDGVSSDYVLHGNKWSTTNLTYAYKKYTPDLSQSAQRAAIRSAFDTWSAVTPLVFSEVGSTSSADIVISFETGNHGDPCNCSFDGRGGVLAHAFFPPPNAGSYAGDLHFDEAELWSVVIPVPSGSFDIQTVAIHELGHSLGLRHSNVSGAIMYAYYGGANHSLHSDDIAGIQALYGANPGGGQTIDAEIVSVSVSPSTVTTGSGVSGVVQVRNNGTQAAQIPVSVSGPGGFSYNQTTGSLGAGQSANVNFSWTANVAGNFTFTATASLNGDSNSGNNSKTSNSVTVNNPPQQTVDAAVVSASASPSTIVQGTGDVTISTSVKNNGDTTANIPIVVVGPGRWSTSTTRTVAAGASVNVQFSWPASVTGTHTFSVRTNLAGDQNANNNIRSTNSVTVTNGAPPPPPGDGSLYVSDVSLTATQSRGGYLVRATISLGPNGSAASGAYVTGYWTGPDNQQTTAAGYANSAGQLTLQRGTAQTGVHTFEVTNVTKSGYTYDYTLDTGNPGQVDVGGGGSTPPPVVIDASINQVTASPSSLPVNSGNVSITATIGNKGSSAATIPVSVSGPGAFSAAQNVSLAAGASAQVTFTWPASVVGNHTFSVSTSLAGDTNASNNTKTTSVNVTAEPPPPGGGAVFVESTQVQKVGTGWHVYVYLGTDGDPIGSGATVTARVDTDSGRTAEFSAVSVADGYALLIIPPVGRGGHTLTVTDIAKSGFTYNAALDSGNPVALP